MLPDKIEHCIVFMNYWDVSGVLWSFSKCKIKIPHLPADPSSRCQELERRAPALGIGIGDFAICGSKGIHVLHLSLIHI